MAGRSMLIFNELGHEIRLEVALETVYGGTIFNGSRNWIPCCRRAVISNNEDAPVQSSYHACRERHYVSRSSLQLSFNCEHLFSVMQYLHTLWWHFNEIRYRYSPCEWALLERFSGSEVKGQGHKWTCAAVMCISQVWHQGSHVYMLFSILPPFSPIDNIWAMMFVWRYR